VDLPMAVGLQQLQVIGLLTAASTAPDPMMDVPGLFLGLKKSPTHHASTPLSLPEILDPASTCQGVGQLPGRPLLPVEFPAEIGVHSFSRRPADLAVRPKLVSLPPTGPSGSPGSRRQ
jgi:hypothetical protein